MGVDKVKKELLMTILLFVIMVAFFGLVRVMFHEYGHMLTGHAMGCDSVIFRHNAVYSRCDYDWQHTIFAFMGGIFASLVLSILAVFLIASPYGKYALIFAIIEYARGINEGLSSVSETAFYSTNIQLIGIVEIAIVGVFWLATDFRNWWEKYGVIS